MLTIDLARPFTTARATEASKKVWGVEPLSIVPLVAAQVAPGAIVLPRTKIDGRPVHPFVCFVADEVRRRRALGVGAVLDREAILRDAEGLDGASVWHPPLTLAGFASTEPLDQARKDLAGLRAYARTALITPRRTVLSSFQAAEFDLAGIAVVAVDAVLRESSVVVPGYGTAAPESSMPEFWIRLRQEQLFALALASGVCRMDGF